MISWGKGDLGQVQITNEQFWIAHQTIETLREAGLLDDIITAKEVRAIYPAAIYL